ncbi:BrnT family toxin [Treponema primitia]|uniref:BrnT family toxin n=1 Tax=Treponema primitia TaxID=88058 RepID=UPI000255523D|nr:BrnT family toxin [Treponema primitia]
MGFEWNEGKNQENIEKHHMSFPEAQEAFFDPKRIIIKDKMHSAKEERFFCIGNTGKGIATVRFTMRDENIRIFGAGYWREGRDKYEQKNNLY